MKLLNSKSILSFFVITSFISCKSRGKIEESDDSFISSSIGDFNTQPEGLTSNLKLYLICKNGAAAEKKFEGILLEADKKVKFAKTGTVKTGESCRMEAWGAKLADKYEYLNESSETEAKYMMTVSNPLPITRKLELYSTLTYRAKVIAEETVTTLTLGQYDNLDANAIATLECQGLGNKNANLNNGFFNFKFTKEDFNAGDTVKCSKISVVSGDKTFKNDSAGITFSKQNSPTLKIDLTEFVAQPQGNDDEVNVSISNTIFDGVYNAECRQANAVASNMEHVKTTVQILTNGDTHQMEKTDAIHFSQDCSDASPSVSTLYYDIKIIEVANISEQNAVYISIEGNNKKFYTLMTMESSDDAGTLLKFASDLTSLDIGREDIEYKPTTTEGGLVFKKRQN